MHMRVLAMAGFVGVRRGRTAESQRLVALMTDAAVIVMSMMMLSVVRLRQHDLPDAMSVATLMGVRRRGRQDAEMRHSEDQKPSQEATKQDHRGIVNARFLPLIEDGRLCAYLPDRNAARGFGQRYWSRGQGAAALSQQTTTRRPPWGWGADEKAAAGVETRRLRYAIASALY